MNALEIALFKTRKSITDVYEELGYVDVVSLLQCSSCNIWLKSSQLIKDLDGLEICQHCKDAYGL